MIAIGVEPEYRSVARSLSGRGPKGEPELWLSLRARSQISWDGDTLVFVFLACYETLEFWIEYSYPLGMKMSCCSIQASSALLFGLEYILSEVVVRCLSIAQCTPVWEREPRFVLQVQPYGQTVLRFGLRWHATWWRGAVFYRHEFIDHWVFARGIDHFLVATPDLADSSSFVVQISLSVNPDDRVVVDGVLISGRAGPSIGFVVAGCLTATWNVVTAFSRPRGNSKPVVIMRRSSYSWVECSRSSYSSVVNGSISNRNHTSVRNFSSLTHGAMSLCQQSVVRYLE
jgi:hypothetical protein